MKQTFIAAILVTGTSFGAATAASAACGLECWLSKTFSTNDFVGDWLKDTFGPIRDDKTPSDETLKMLKMADMSAEGWKPGQETYDRDIISKAKPNCELQTLLKVASQAKSPDAVMKNCF